MREKLIRSFHHHNPSFHLKRVPKFTTRQKLVLISLCLVDFTSFCAMSILAPFFPQEATEKGVSITVSGLIFSVYALIVFLGKNFIVLEAQKLNHDLLGINCIIYSNK